MNYYLKRAKIVLDLEDQTFERNVKKCPTDAISVDYLSIEPGCTETRVENLIINLKPVCVLELNAWDVVTLINLFGVMGWIGKRGLDKRACALIYQNFNDGLDTAIRAGLGLRAPGECAAWVKKQIQTRPDDWKALQMQARKGM
ncbi:hypothetical protein [Paracoccus yeei]|uniref:hypothetical protein n=1 Tax=Paracoccus yeei TaxID=147645 RepID=UPI00174DC253|nr:hypothetical protein [Paracoccus yeei]